MASPNCCPEIVSNCKAFWVNCSPEVDSDVDVIPHTSKDSSPKNFTQASKDPNNENINNDVFKPYYRCFVLSQRKLWSTDRPGGGITHLQTWWVLVNQHTHTPSSAQWWLSDPDLLRFTTKTSIHEGTERAPKNLWKEIALHLLVCFMVFSRESVTFHSLAGNRASRKPTTTSGCDFQGEIWNVKRCRSAQDDAL